MRIGLDMQAARGEVTGLGRYALGLRAAMRTAAGIECVELGLTGAAHLRTPARMLREQFLPLRMRHHGLDILHLPAFAPPLWGAARRVCTLHDLNILDDARILAPGLSRFYWRTWLPHLAARADAIITPSGHTALRFRRHFPHARASVHVIAYPPGAEFQTASPEECRRVQVKYRLAKAFCLGVGALEERKDWLLVLAALARLPHELCPQLVLAGPEREQTQALMKHMQTLQLGERVRRLSYVPLADLVALYSCARLLLFPDRNAGYGLPVLEAMACGAPVLSLACAALPETCAGAAALLEPPFTPARLAQRWAELLRLPQRRIGLRRKGWERVSRLSWPATMAQVIVVYESVLREGIQRPKTQPAWAAGGVST